jgi:membrane protease YdiL (CAAX protease family)
MSDPTVAGAPATVAPEMPAVQTPLRRRALVAAFSLDVVLAVLIVVATGVALGFAWGLWRVLDILRTAGSKAPDLAALGEPGVLGQLVITVLSTSAAAVLLYFLRRPAAAVERRQSLATMRDPVTWAWAVAAGVAVFLGSSLIAWLASLAGIDPEPTNLAMVDAAMRQWPLFLVLFAVVLAPAYEELLFRRVLFGRFLDGGRPWLGLFLSSLAFALVHEIPGTSANPPLAILQLWLVYGGMGAVFGWLYWRTGSLWAPIVAHGLNNGIALVAHNLI